MCAAGACGPNGWQGSSTMLLLGNRVVAQGELPLSSGWVRPAKTSPPGSCRKPRAMSWLVAMSMWCSTSKSAVPAASDASRLANVSAMQRSRVGYWRLGGEFV